MTLDTLGEDDLGGALRGRDWFSAHPRTHPSGDVWNFGIAYGARPRARLYRCRADGSVSRETAVTLPRLGRGRVGRARRLRLSRRELSCACSSS